MSPRTSSATRSTATSTFIGTSGPTGLSLRSCPRRRSRSFSCLRGSQSAIFVQHYDGLRARKPRPEGASTSCSRFACRNPLRQRGSRARSGDRFHGNRTPTPQGRAARDPCMRRPFDPFCVGVGLEGVEGSVLGSACSRVRRPRHVHCRGPVCRLGGDRGRNRFRRHDPGLPLASALAGRRNDGPRSCMGRLGASPPDSSEPHRGSASCLRCRHPFSYSCSLRGSLERSAKSTPSTRVSYWRAPTSLRMVRSRGATSSSSTVPSSTSAPRSSGLTSSRTAAGGRTQAACWS